MKFEAYSFVFQGLDPEPYYAAVTSEGRSLWAAASGNAAGSAMTLAQSLTELDAGSVVKNDSDIENVFLQLQPAMQRMKMEVSAAGAYSDGKNLHLFNLGNARAFLFKDGYVMMHTEDHSEAYRVFQSQGTKCASDYDAIRLSSNRIILTRALGMCGDVRPQFYTPVPLQKNTSILICTEAFWRYLNVIEMELDYRKSAGPEEWLKYLIRRVLMKSNREIDKENFAAAAVMVEE